jgi:hypothetical protein
LKISKTVFIVTAFSEINKLLVCLTSTSSVLIACASTVLHCYENATLINTTFFGTFVINPDRGADVRTKINFLNWAANLNFVTKNIF